MRRPMYARCLVMACACGLASTASGQALSQQGNRAEAREIFRQLVETPTAEADGATPLAARLMANRLTAAGFPPADVQVLSPDGKVGHLVARLRGRDPRARPILLMAHIDVVPALRADWSVDPWKLLERDGWFYGRGTSDNKAGAAMLVANFVRMKREGWQPRHDIIIVLTGDEETSQTGMQWLLKEHRPLIDAQFALNTDSGGILMKDGHPSMFAVQAGDTLTASPLPPAMLSRIEGLVAKQWAAIPVVPVMEAGATDGMFTRRAGIPTYALSAVLGDPNDVRAHGKDERVGVDAFYQATEFWYQMVKAFGDGT